ncbi:MAG: hypothetical protein M3323_11670 [Actinomycetota bacterium]|nr:hypothetical protein [Actinomycetota bacterium]
MGWTENPAIGTGRYPYVDGSYIDRNAYHVEYWSHSPGDQMVVGLRPVGNGIWVATVSSARIGGWIEMSRFDLGADQACTVAQQVELRTGGRDFLFSPVRFGDGTTNGVLRAQFSHRAYVVPL